MERKSLRCSINENEFLLLRDYINDISGILIPPEKAYLIETKLTTLMLDAGTDSFGEFYKHLVSSADPKLPEKIINAITTNETLWFRDGTPWKVLEQTVLPKYVKDILSGRRNRVRIWFAGVSTGQEAYSTAMFIDDYLKRKGIQGVSLSNFDMLGTDISTRVLDSARSGRYDKISINRGLDDHFRDNYFSENGSAWDIDPGIKDAVKFMRLNMKDSFVNIGRFDIIFCRYILIYFSNEMKKEISEKIYKALTPGGVLFTGNYVLYEVFREKFDQNHYENLTYYTKKEDADGAACS